MTVHSKVCGGSTASQYINCIGSTALKAKMPEQQAGEAAWRGSMLHNVIEDTLGADEGFDPYTFIGNHIEIDDIDPKTGENITVEVTEHHIDTKIMPALDWFDEVLSPDDFWLEQCVRFDGELEGAFGPADVLFHSGDKAGIVDWKFGDGILVSAEDNDQMKFYLSAAIKKGWFGKNAEGEDFQEFDAYIVQPIEDADEIISHTIFTRQELLDFEQELLDAKKAKDSGDKTTTVGKWCQFCEGKPICDSWRDRGKNAIAPLVVQHVSRETLKDGVTPKKPTKPSTTKAVCDDLDHKELKTAYLEAREVHGWANSVIEYVKKEFEAGRPIEGLKKVIQSTSSQWEDEKKAESWCRNQGYKVEDYKAPRVLLSVAKIEKLVGKGKIKEGLIRKASKAFSIVNLDDPRPAVDSNTDDSASASNALAEALGNNT